MNDPLPAIIAFLDTIGIPVQLAAVADDAFLPGVRIAGGALTCDPARLRWPGDLLHEAGHLAVTPTAMRPTLQDALATDNLAPHGGEIEAIAWSYAAARHLGLDPAVVFHADGYHGQAAALLANYALGIYLGAPGLAAAGMTCMASYPAMLRWLRA